MKLVSLKYLLLLLVATSPLLACAFEYDRAEDIYLIFYTTKKGHTGHVGIAVDNYKIVGTDLQTITVYDTLKNHTLSYFDLWGPAKIDWNQHNENLASRYYTLPRSSAEEKLTVKYFLNKGLPHSYDYPCDALVRIKTDPATDYRLKQIATKIQEEKNYFNTRQYNCTDYIILCINRLLGTDLEAKEYIPFSWSSTPNKLYQEIISQLDVEVIKNAGPEVDDSFFKERVINTILTN